MAEPTLCTCGHPRDIHELRGDTLRECQHWDMHPLGHEECCKCGRYQPAWTKEDIFG